MTGTETPTHSGVVCGFEDEKKAQRSKFRNV